MAKGLLRKALQGASTSASEMLGARIEDMRMKRMADYQFGQQKELIGLQDANQTARDERQAAQRAQEATTAFERGIQATTFEMGARANLERETEDQAQANRLGLEQERSRLRTEEDRIKYERELELAQAKASQTGGAVQTFKIPSRDEMGGVATIEVSGVLNPDGTISFPSVEDMEMLSVAEREERQLAQAFVTDSYKFAENIRNAPNTDRALQRAVQEWAEGFQGQMPLPEAFSQMGDRGPRVEQMLRQMYGETTGSETPPAASAPEQPRSFSVGPTEVEVAPSLLSRAQSALRGSYQDLADSTRREVADTNAMNLLPHFQSSDGSRVRLPQVTILNRQVYRSALDSDLLTPEQKAIIQAMLDRDANR
jgi:hypothetical protein